MVIAGSGPGFYGQGAPALAPQAKPARVVVAARAWAALRTASVGALPREAGGVLGGITAGDTLCVQTFVLLPNREPGDDRFEVDPLDFLAAHDQLVAAGLTLLGFAHSHPFGTCAPSAADARELWRHHLHLLAAPDATGACPLAAWWHAGAGFLPLPLAMDAWLP